MLALIDKNKSGRCAILDTDDGVVEYVSENEFITLRKSGFRIYNKPEFSFCITLFSEMTKYTTLNKDFDIDFYKKVYNYLLKLSSIIKLFKVPNNLYRFDIMITNIPSCYLILLKRRDEKDPRDYLYSVTSDGIFCFNQYMFNVPFSIEQADSIGSNIQIITTSEKKVMTYGIFEVDTHLNILEQSKYEPPRDTKIGRRI